MGDEISIDKSQFHDRLSGFIAAWKNDKRSGSSTFSDVGSIVILLGKASEGGYYHKSAAFQLWLLGYEFPATLFVITQDAIHIVTTKKKAAYLEPLKGGKVPVEIYVRGKDAEENKKQFDKCLEVIKAAGKKVGVIQKDPVAGAFAEEWKKALEEGAKDAEEVDVAVAISTSALGVKDEKELRSIRDASKASSNLLTEYFVETMSDVLDEDKKMTHKALADKVQGKIDDNKFFAKLKISSTFDQANLDWGVYPTVQSGGNYDLKFMAEPDESNLYAGVIICALGLRYSTYTSVVARTYMVDPNKSQEANYKILLQAHEMALKTIRDGVPAKDVYSKALGIVKAKDAKLEKHFVKSVGAGIGIENKDNTLLLSPKNGRVLKDGMTLQITTGFTGLENPSSKSSKDKTYSMAISDTVRVTTSDTAVFTREAPSDIESVAFYFKDEEEKPKAKSKKDSKIGAVAQSNIKSTRLRGERQTMQDAEKEAQRREHQKEIHQKKQSAGLEKYSEGTGNLNGVEEKKFKRFESYKRDNQFPTRVKDLMIVVDVKNSTVVLPIMGRPVPFHINTIKNATASAEGSSTSLRINFLSPGQGVGRKDDQPFEDPGAHFVRSLTFRSKDIDRMDEISKQITELKKEVVRKETEKKQLEDVVEQDKLTTIKNRKPHILDMIFVRPALDGKRVPGQVEIHQNGIRYQHGNRDQKIDVLFSNIKHLFFQPSQHELIVIIHIHLINPIMIGKKKTKDVQFYREATEMAFDETGNRKRKHRYGDEEEFEAEQEERRRRAQLDKEFKNFAEKIADAGRAEGVAVDVPFRELGFNGVPSRSNVYIQPTTDCLVQLTEPPFFVVTLNEVEIVHLERVQFGLKNFDMVVVFKDFNKPPAHVNTIPVESLDSVKDWLDSVEIPFSEGPLNLNWATIMKTVTQDPHRFFKDGGWSFLAAESDDEDGEESEEESAFEISDEELEQSDESSEEGSDFDENASAEASDEASDMSADEEGEDWDELEKKAKKKDRESGLEDEDDTKRKKKR